MSARTRISCLLLALAGCAAPRRPNVVFLISDDLSASALACYGNVDCATPNIDRLAARGVRFTHAYCQYPVCAPSRAALMSGLYPQAIGVDGNGGARKFAKNLGERPSLGQHFIAAGYYTARVSKIYHMRVPGDITAGVDGPDHVESWTERFNCQGPEWATAGEHAMLSNETLNPVPDKHYNLGFGTAFYSVQAAPGSTRQPDAQAADKAIELMRTHRDEPFFLAVGFVRPHVPLVSPAEYYSPYAPQGLALAEAHSGDWDDIPKPGISGYNSKRRGLESADKQREVLQAYYAAVTFMDAQVGRVLDELEDLGLADDTIVVFASDHGFHLGEHDFWQKLSLHEESARIPMIFAGPGIEPGESAALTEQIDLYPTFASLAGLSVPEHCQGQDLSPLFTGAESSVRDAAYCRKGGAHLIRTSEFAYIEYPQGEVELYDMLRDPQQFTNLAEVASYAETRAALAEALRRKLAEITAAGVPAR